MVEALFVIAITAIVIVAIGHALKNAAQSARVNAHILDTRQQAINGLNFVMNAIRQAKAIHLYDSSGNEVATNVATAPKLKTVRVIDPSNGAELVYSTFDLDTAGGNSYLRVTNELGTSDPALDAVTALSFTAPVEPLDGLTRRQVTVNMAVRIVDPMAPHDLSKARILNLQAIEVARCIIKP